jgi:hypothetical protein
VRVLDIPVAEEIQSVDRFLSCPRCGEIIDCSRGANPQNDGAAEKPAGAHAPRPRRQIAPFMEQPGD